MATRKSSELTRVDELTRERGLRLDRVEAGMNDLKTMIAELSAKLDSMQREITKLADVPAEQIRMEHRIDGYHAVLDDIRKDLLTAQRDINNIGAKVNAIEQRPHKRNSDIINTIIRYAAIGLLGAIIANSKEIFTVLWGAG